MPMSEESAEQLRGSRRTVALARLYLDPNNFRIVDHEDYREVAPEEVFNADVQRRTTAIVLGRSQEQVRDLIASIRENGWLDIDPILVRAQDRKGFLVVEGNRRVATLKHLQRRHEEAAVDLGRLDNTLFSRVPVVLHEADERDNMVLMGLHHITGKRRWPAINRARAMKRLRKHFQGDEDAVCRALGISKREFNLSVRTLALVDAYRTSDYGDQFESEQYNLFREIVRSPAMRDWLGWEHATAKAAKTSNLERLFDWMSRGEDTEVAEDEAEGAPQETAPVITTAGHIRELAKIIGDPTAVKRLDETRSLQEATLSSTLLVKSEIDRAFAACDNGLQKLNTRVGELQSDDLDRVEQLIGKLQGVALARKRQPPSAGNRLPWQPFNDITQSQFSAIEVGRYRGIDGLVLDDPGRVNLIVGVNNAGKTSLLEAIYLLAHRNDERALLDVIRWRGRMERDPDPLWLVEQLPPVIQLSGCFDRIECNRMSFEARVLPNPGDDIRDQTDFLSQLFIESEYGGRSQTTDVVIFGNDRRRTRFQGRQWLCRSAFTSSFWSSRPETLAQCNKESLEAGTKQRIIDFIREHLDPGLHNIELADRFNRFLVRHDDFLRRAPDLASFGEGVRRVFEIGLLFAGVRGGVLLIDEFENAIHTELLVPFTRIVQQLAADLNVQVFLTTHSKEAIDALLLNKCCTADIVGYAVSRTDEGARVRRYGGERLLRLHEAIDFDLRGIR